MTQDDKVETLLNNIAYDVTDFFEEFKRPVRSTIILQGYRNRISKLGLDWHIVEQKLKQKGFIRIRRHEQTNKRWYFPPLPEFADETLTEMIQLMDN